MTKIIRILLIILIVFGIVTAVYWFEPNIISSLNPFGGRKDDVSPVTANLSSQNIKPGSDINLTDSGSAENDKNIKNEDGQEQLSPFDKEIRQRHESYKTKVYTYEPYVPPVMRNPFQRIVNSVYLGDEEEEIADNLSTEEDIRRFVQPELPPASKFTGLISSVDKKLAILEIDDETYIVKEGDLILDKFLVKSIQEEKVIIDINGYGITLQLGGGEASNG